jgi:thiosulfate/3-mercaptopyruvate sulfurtransferase
MSKVSRNDLLVEPEWLKTRLGQDNIRVLDATTHMIAQPVGSSKIVSGLSDFLEGHIPGASHVDMATDLSDPDGPYPFTMLDSNQFAALMQRLGIKPSDHVVLYGRSAMSTITRAWAVLHVNGHEKVSILNGGWSAWVNAGGLVSTENPDIKPSVYEVRQPRFEHIVGLEEVRAVAKQAPQTLVNALTRVQFTGSGGPHYGRVGRIPGSANVPARELFDLKTNRFVSADQMQSLFTAAGINWEQPIIHYCGGGIAASTSAFAQSLLGHDNWAIYDHSLLQWSVQPDTPMVTG